MDTGPLVAYFCRTEARHAWAVEQFEMLEPPILTCEPVLTETCFLLRRANVPAARLLEKVRPGVLQVGIRLDQEAGAIADFMHRYRNLPMSFADACLVRLAEISGLPICTLDSDFTIYRGHRGARLNLISPTQ
jgi:predicted nucleic acid-binding protein